MTTNAPALGTLFDMRTFEVSRQDADVSGAQGTEHPCAPENAPERLYARSTGIVGLTGAGCASFRGYTPDMSDAEIRAAFATRYGCEPRELRRLPAAVLAGPCPGV